MVPASRIFALAVGMLLALGAATPIYARALMQEENLQEPTGVSPDKPPSSNDGELNHPPQPLDQKADDNAASPRGTDGTKQPDGSGQPAVASGDGKDQKGKPAGDGVSARTTRKPGAKPKFQSQPEKTKTAAGASSEIQNAAQQILKSLDVAMSVEQKSGTLGPVPPAGKRANDISVRRVQLQQKAQAAKDDKAWAGVAADAARALVDTVQLMETNPSDRAASGQDSGGQASSGQAGMNPAPVPHAVDREPFFRPSQLPLFVAGLSLVFSLLGLGSGWFLARREINKALIEAGLL